MFPRCLDHISDVTLFLSCLDRSDDVFMFLQNVCATELAPSRVIINMVIVSANQTLLDALVTAVL